MFSFELFGATIFFLNQLLWLTLFLRPSAPSPSICSLRKFVGTRRLLALYLIRKTK